MTRDGGKAELEKLMSQWELVLESINNGADTRFRLIDQILSDCLVRLNQGANGYRF